MACFPILVAAGGAIMDLLSSRVDNWWTLGALTAGLILRLLSEGWAGLFSGLLGALLPLLLLGGLFVFHMMGAGDIKLFMALGAYLGPGDIGRCMALALFLGAIYSFFFLIFSGTILRRFQVFFSYLNRVKQRGEASPYRGSGEQEGTFPFALAILGAVLLLYK